MGNQIARLRQVRQEKKELRELDKAEGHEFPGSDFACASADDRKQWMQNHLDATKIRVRDIIWPGTHDSATSRIGIPCISRPFAKCQSCCVYRQLCLGARLLDLRVQKDRRVCHGVLRGQPLECIIDEVLRFLRETVGELLVVEIRTEYGHEDPPEMEKWLCERFGEDLLVPQDPAAFENTVAEVLPRRVICIWRPSKGPAPPRGSPLWSAAYIKDDWIDTDLPYTKFQSNLEKLGKQAPVAQRRYFYRVENTVTPQADNPVVCVWPVTMRIHDYARLFLSQAFKKGFGNRLQVFSTDFIDADFVDACVGLTVARMDGKA